MGGLESSAMYGYARRTEAMGRDAGWDACLVQMSDGLGASGLFLEMKHVSGPNSLPIGSVEHNPYLVKR